MLLPYKFMNRLLRPHLFSTYCFSLTFLTLWDCQCWRISDFNFYLLVLNPRHFAPVWFFFFFWLMEFQDFMKLVVNLTAETSKVAIRDIVNKSFQSALSPFCLTRIMLHMTDLVQKMPEVPAAAGRRTRGY